ncbi:unnamed protein product [Closterium sp. NIES-54]
MARAESLSAEVARTSARQPQTRKADPTPRDTRLEVQLPLPPRTPPSLPAMTSLRRSGGSGDGGGGGSGGGGGRPRSRCGAARRGVSGGGQMRLQQRQRESLTPQQLREWYTSRGGGGGSSGSHSAAVPLGVPGGGLPHLQRRPRETLTPQQLREWYVQRGASRSSARCPYVIRTGDRAGLTCGTVGHTQSRCFSYLSDTWCVEFGDATELPRWLELVRQGVDIFALYYDAILTAMYALSASAEGDCSRCVPPDPGIAANALGASESGTPPGTAPAVALHTFTLDSGASRCFFRDSTTLTPLPEPVPIRLADPSRGPVVASSSTVLPCPAVPSGSLSGLHLPSFSTNLVSRAALQDAMVATTTLGGQRVSICTCTRTGRHVATFTLRPGSSPYTLATEPPQVVASAQVSASGQVAASCLCRLLSDQTLLWHHRLGHPSLQRLRGMHSRLLGRERYFLLVVDDYTRYTTIFPLRSKGEVSAVLIPWICTVRLQLHERFGQDQPVLRLHSDRGGEFSSDLLQDFCRGEGILQSFTLPDSPQQNGIAERRIGLVMEVARTSMIHAAAPHFLRPFAVRYAAHQLNLWPRVSLPETSPTLRWTGKVGDVSVFQVWDSRAFVRDTSADKLSARAISCIFLGFVLDAPGWQFYHPTSLGVLPSHDVTFDESVPFYRLFPYCSAPPPPPPLFLAPGPPPVDPLVPQDPAPSGVSQVDPLPGNAPAQVAVGSGAALGAASGGAASGGAEPGGAGSEGAGSGGAEHEGVEPGGAESEGTESGGAEPRGAASSGAPGAGEAGDTGAGGAAVTTRAGGTGGTAATGPGGTRTNGAGAAGAGGAGAGGAGVGGPSAGGAGAAGAGVGGTGAGGAGAAGDGAVDPGAGGAGDTVRLRPYFPASPLPAPSPYTEQSGGLTERREPASRPISPVCTARRAPRSRPPPVPGTHTMAFRPSSVPLRVPLPAPPESSLLEVPDPASDRAHAASPTVARPLATVVTDPSFESAVGSALVAELLDFAATCRLDYASTLVAESVPASPPYVGGECAIGTDVLEDRQEDFECLAAAVPCFASMLLAPEGDPDAPDISAPRSYAEATTSPYSSKWQAAMDAEMASWKSTGTYVNAVPPSRASIVDGMWIFRVKRPPGSPAAFKARYIARGFIYGLRQAPREWHDTLRTTLAALGFAPSAADPSLFLRTDTSLPPFYVLVYVDDLVFATADTKALTLVKSELQKKHTCTHLGQLRSYLGLQITRDRARRTITLTQSHMVHQVLQRFGFQFSSPQPTALSTSHSLSAPPSDESVEPSGPYPELVGCLITSGMGLVLGERGPVVLTGHADASCVDDSATQRSSQGYTFSLGSGSVSWWSTRSFSVLSSSCEAEIYDGAMAAQELCCLTYLLTDLGEKPRSPPILYVDNKAMIALCQEHRLEHRTKHIALRYFLARELQQRGQLRLAYVATWANIADVFTKALPSATDGPRCIASDESVEPSGPYPELVGCLITSGMGLVLGERGPVVLTGHADASCVDDSATQRSSQGYTFSLGSDSVSWWSTRSFSVLSSSCEAEINDGAMAAQELRCLTYLLTDLGEKPRSPPILYVDNKAMIALCQEHRLEHITKHIALRYFLARELQQRGQLRLAYVATWANIADVFTKALPSGDHQRFATVLCLVPTLPHLLTA